MCVCVCVCVCVCSVAHARVHGVGIWKAVPSLPWGCARAWFETSETLSSPLLFSSSQPSWMQTHAAVVGVCPGFGSSWCTFGHRWLRLWCEVVGLCWNGYQFAVISNVASMREVCDVWEGLGDEGRSPDYLLSHQISQLQYSPSGEMILVVAGNAQVSRWRMCWCCQAEPTNWLNEITNSS